MVNYFLLANEITYTDWILFATIILLIVCAAFFAASETAFSSVNIMHVKTYAEQKVKGARRAKYICDHYDLTLVCLLVGNLLANIANTTICAYLFSKFISSPTIANILNTVVMTVIILIFGEILPKAYAKHNPEKLALMLSGMVYFFIKAVYILAVPFYALQKLVVRKSEETKITQDEFGSIVDTMKSQGTIGGEGADIIHGTMNLGEKTVYDIFVPRVDMIAIPLTATEKEIFDIYSNNQFNRVPVYSEDKDNIVGVLNFKDYIVASKNSKKVSIEKLMLPPLRVSETMKVDELIKLMRKEKKHLAVVVDQYGGTSGVVTIENALEILVGKMYDEHAADEKEPMRKIGKNKFDVDPEMSVESLFKFLEIENLPETKYPSVGGMIYGLSENLPENGTVVNVETVDDVLNEKDAYVSITTKLVFTVEKVEDNRIKQISLVVEKTEK